MKVISLLYFKILIRDVAFYFSPFPFISIFSFYFFGTFALLVFLHFSLSAFYKTCSFFFPGITTSVATELSFVDLASCTSSVVTNEISFLVSICEACGMPFFQCSLLCDALAVTLVFVTTCLPLQVKIMRNGVYPDLRMSHTHT